MCHDFGSPDTDPIPMDFFGSGSDLFTSSVCLRGVPLGIEEYGDADTLISRDADPFDRCDLPSGTSSTVNIEIVALSLEGVNPITVTYGGSNPETWDVTVDISPSGLLPGTPPSTLTAIKTHCNGGTYTSVLYVQPRFTFKKVSDPTQVRVLDTFDTETPPVELTQSDPHPWVSDIDPDFGASVDLCSDFHAQISESNSSVECDCNSNDQRDVCDVEQGTSQDCNTNSKPDECDIEDGTSQDIDEDGRPDECPVNDPPQVGDNTCQTAGADTGVPCNTDADCTPPAVCGSKVRYLSITPANAGVPSSIRVRVLSAPQFPALVGSEFFAGPEQNIPNSPNAAQRGALIQCIADPHQQVWTTGPLHLFGAGIVPTTTYAVSHCDGLGDNCSTELNVQMAKWGDVVRPFRGGSQPNFGDVSAIVAKFGNVASAPSTPRADLVGPQAPGTPNTPNQGINFADVSNDVSAFSGFQYPYTVTACPP